MLLDPVVTRDPQGPAPGPPLFLFSVSRTLEQSHPYPQFVADSQVHVSSSALEFPADVSNALGAKLNVWFYDHTRLSSIFFLF